MKKMNAFTLAEVLITLGIIGVVAAMTMPTLMSSTQGAQYKAAYKKALSALSQAVTLNVALDEWNFADATGTSPYTIKEMLTNRMNVVRTESGAGNMKGPDGTTTYAPTVATGAKGAGGSTSDYAIGDNTTLFFNDGIMFTFPDDVKECTIGTSNFDAERDKLVTNKCVGFIDVNGIKAPNRVVQCDDGDGTDANCVIKSPTDVYPVIFYDQTIRPNSVAARAVLYSK